MTEPIARSPLADLAVEEFADYFSHLADRVEQVVRSVPEGSLWTKPFAFGNSIGHLVLHLTGNLNHFVGAEIGGTGYVRNREEEFTAPHRPSGEELIRRFRDTISLVVGTIRAQDDAGLLVAVEPRQSIHSRLGILLMCASHMNNHIGQMSYLVQALTLSNPRSEGK